MAALSPSDSSSRKRDGGATAQPSFLERYAGWIIAACLFVMAGAWLVMQRRANDSMPLLTASIESNARPATTSESSATVALQTTMQAPETSPSIAASSMANALASAQAYALASAQASASRTDLQQDQKDQTMRPAPDALPTLDPSRPPTVLADAAGTTNTDQFDPRAPRPLGIIYALMPEPSPPPANPEATPPPAETPPPAPTAAPEPAEAIQIPPETLAALQARSQQMIAANLRQGSAGSDDVARRLNAAMADQTAQKTLYHAPTMTPGVLRTIDLSDTDMTRAQEVLNRYGIQIKFLDVHRDVNVAPAPDGGFLSGIQTQTGMFVRPEKLRAGIYQAFTFGAIAESQMARLEAEALAERKLDPAKTRVVRVVFGVVSTGKGFDLGVKVFESAPIPDSAPPAKP